MIYKILFLIFLELCAILSFSVPPTASKAETKPLSPSLRFYRPTIGINFNNIRMLDCEDARTGKKYVGTAFFADGGKLITAAHVVQGRSCKDGNGLGEVKVLNLYQDMDYAIIEMPVTLTRDAPRINCDGFLDQSSYDSIGYAEGTRLVLNRVTATDKFTPIDHLVDGLPGVHLRVLRGDILHGMSGGPILDNGGNVVGINTATNEYGVGLSRSLSDTVLCSKPSL